MEEFLSKVSSTLDFDVSTLFTPENRVKTAVVSAVALSTTLSITYILKKRFYDYPAAMTPPNSQIALFESTSKTFMCPNGSIIEYQEYGDSTGFPIICFHGHGVQHLEGALFDNAAKLNKLRLIYISRPGCGLKSTFPTNLSPDLSSELTQLGDMTKAYPLSSYMSDINTFISALGLQDKKYGVMGASLGNIFSFSCLYYLKNIKPRILISISGVALTSRNDFLNNPNYINTIPKDWMPNIINKCNCFKERFEQRISKFISFYYQKSFIKMFKPMWIKKDAPIKAREPELTDDEIKEEIEEVIVLGYSIGQSYKYGINGNLWSRQVFAQDKGFTLNDINDEMKEESGLKIFLNMGRYDALNVYEYYMAFYNELTGKYGFKNVELNLYDTGHWIWSRNVKDVFGKVSGYLKQIGEI